MADAPVAASAGPDGGSSPRDDLGGVLSETLRQLHQDESRQAGRELLAASALTVLGGASCVVSERVFANPGAALLPAYLTARTMFRIPRLAQQWWDLRRSGPSNRFGGAQSSDDQLQRAHGTLALPGGPPWVTEVIVGAIFLIGMLELWGVGSMSRVSAVASLDKSKVASGEWWRLLTASFVHGAVWQLYLNLAALSAIGRVVEAYSTRSRLLLAYLASVLAGNLASWWLLPHSVPMGASGGILGLAGFAYALSLRRPDEFPPRYRRAALVMIALAGLVGLIAAPLVDNAMHVGGALAGFLIGWTTNPSQLPQGNPSITAREEDWTIRLIGIGATVLLAASATVTGVKVIGERPRSVTSVHVDLKPRSGGGFSVLIHNIANAPLEAYTLEVSSADGLGFRQWRDERGFDPDGPIGPHDQRLVPLGDQRTVFRQPSVRVVAAMFQDGTFEGSADEYSEIAKRRIGAAADADFWIAAIDEVSRVPLDQIAPLVDAKIREHAGRNALGRRTEYLDTPWILRTAALNPERFKAAAAPERARLVQLGDELRGSVR